MKKIIEGIKDIVHDSIDVILVIVILLVVGGTILWRLDILFATEMDKPAINQPSDDDVATDGDSINSPSDSNDNSSPITDDSSSEQNQDNSDSSNDSENNSNNDTGGDNNDSGDSNNTDEETNENDEPIIVVIPNGSLAPDVRDIVYDLGLIQSEEYWTFLSRAQEMELDTKFQSGTFKIEKGASLDTIIKTIARAL